MSRSGSDYYVNSRALCTTMKMKQVCCPQPKDYTTVQHTNKDQLLASIVWAGISLWKRWPPWNVSMSQQESLIKMKLGYISDHLYFLATKPETHFLFGLTALLGYFWEATTNYAFDPAAACHPDLEWDGEGEARELVINRNMLTSDTCGKFTTFSSSFACFSHGYWLTTDCLTAVHWLKGCKQLLE